MAISPFRLSIQFSEGGGVDFDPIAVKPFDAQTLLAQASDDLVALDLEIQSDGAVVNGAQREGIATFRTRVTFPQSVNVFSLVEGGWLPMPFTIPARFLVDRNIVILLRRIREGNLVSTSEALHWWTRLFDQGSALFNPLLYAWEGGARRKPTRREFEESFQEGAAEIALALPACAVVRYGAREFDAAYGQLEAFDRRGDRELRFLTEACIAISDRPSAPQLWRRAREVLLLADKHGVRRGSLPSLAALSCVFEEAQGTVPSIGRRLLKPKPSYTEADAFNALSDLRHVELTAAGRVIFGAESFALCTCDRALAMFWSALSMRGEAIDADKMEFTYDLTRDLFTRLDEQGILDLRDMLAE